MNRAQGLGFAVRALRKERGLTQETLAEMANLHINSVSDVERGVKLPTLETFFAIADALGVAEEDLMAEMKRHAAGSTKPARKSSAIGAGGNQAGKPPQRKA